MKKFDINNKSFDMIVEKEPTDQYKPAYIIDEEKVKKIIKLNNGEIVWRYIEGYNQRYILGCNGELWRFDNKACDWVKVRFTQVKNGLQTKLLTPDKKRKTKKLSLLMKETFPELITYDKIKIEEEKIKGQNDIVRQQMQNNAKIKCYNSVTNKISYYMTIAQASKATGINEIIIGKNLSKEINSIGGLTFYYN